ncbi:MAG: FHA domain-containing protein [Thermoguttaceae bacterium]|jgi:pSer/pThr/pTyr-binding forkhead associated (FHA) protein
MMVVLIPLDHEELYHYFALDEASVMIGRCHDAGVHLADPEVSRRHCEVSQLDGSLVVRDLGSSNGTFVNGSRVAEAILKPGDELTVGKTRFEVQCESSPVAAWA